MFAGSKIRVGPSLTRLPHTAPAGSAAHSQQCQALLGTNFTPSCTHQERGWSAGVPPYTPLCSESDSQGGRSQHPGQAQPHRCWHPVIK